MEVNGLQAAVDVGCMSLDSFGQEVARAFKADVGRFAFDVVDCQSEVWVGVKEFVYDVHVFDRKALVGVSAEVEEALRSLFGSGN